MTFKDIISLREIPNFEVLFFLKIKYGTLTGYDIIKWRIF